jgi:hypothetical protein
MKAQVKKDRDPAHVLGWLTTSANYTVVTSSAPMQHKRTELRDSRARETANSGAAQENLKKTGG